MACIQQRGERKYKITVCNGYKPNGQKRMQARTITVPKEVAKRGIQQYVMAEAERLEKRFRTGIDQSENTRFEDYANRWLERMAKRYKVSTLEGYRRMLEAVYPAIGGLPLCKIRPMVLEELCEELRQRPGRNGQSLSENTVHKYLDTISAVLQDAVKNDILLYNPAHRVDKLRRGKCRSCCNAFCRNHCFTGCTICWPYPPVCAAGSCAPCGGGICTAETNC